MDRKEVTQKQMKKPDIVQKQKEGGQVTRTACNKHTNTITLSQTQTHSHKHYLVPINGQNEITRNCGRHSVVYTAELGRSSLTHTAEDEESTKGEHTRGARTGGRARKRSRNGACRWQGHGEDNRI
jgi:hypothetical protein